MKKFETVVPDLAKLTPALVNSRIQTENNALYQVVTGLINLGNFGLSELKKKFNSEDSLPASQIQGVITTDQGGTESGIYSPAITLENNLSGVGLDEIYWTRIGNFVTVWGVLQVTPTTGGLTTSFGMALPILSYFTFVSQLAGMGIGNQLPETIVILADTTNNRAQFIWLTTVTGTQFYLPFSFSYQIRQQP